MQTFFFLCKSQGLVLSVAPISHVPASPVLRKCGHSRGPSLLCHTTICAYAHGRTAPGGKSCLQTHFTSASSLVTGADTRAHTPNAVKQRASTDQVEKHTLVSCFVKGKVSSSGHTCHPHCLVYLLPSSRCHTTAAHLHVQRDGSLSPEPRQPFFQPGFSHH